MPEFKLLVLISCKLNIDNYNKRSCLSLPIIKSCLYIFELCTFTIILLYYHLTVALIWHSIHVYFLILIILLWERKSRIKIFHYKWENRGRESLNHWSMVTLESKFIPYSLYWWASQFSSVAQLCLTLCDPMNHSTPGLPVHHQLPEFTQTHIHRVSDAIQPSHPQYFGHLMRRVDSLEKTLMLGGIGGRRRRGQWRMRWLVGMDRVYKGNYDYFNLTGVQTWGEVRTGWKDAWY